MQLYHSPPPAPSATSLIAVIVHKIEHGPLPPEPLQFIMHYHIFRHYRQVSFYAFSFCAFYFNATSEFTPIFEFKRYNFRFNAISHRLYEMMFCFTRLHVQDLSSLLSCVWRLAESDAISHVCGLITLVI